MWDFGLLMLGIVGLPIPDETLLMFTGYLIFKHELEPLPAFAAGFWEASVASPSAMRWVACLDCISSLVSAAFYMSCLRISTMSAPGTRARASMGSSSAISFPYTPSGGLCGGSSRLSLPVFATFAYLGGLLWSSSFISIGYVLGDEWEQMSASLQRYLLIGAGVITVVIATGFILMRRKRPTPKVGLNSASTQLRHGFDELAEGCGEVSIEPAHAQGPGESAASSRRRSYVRQH